MYFDQPSSGPTEKPWLDVKLYKVARLRGWAWDTFPWVHIGPLQALLSLRLAHQPTNQVFWTYFTLILSHWVLFLLVYWLFPASTGAMAASSSTFISVEIGP